MKIEELDVVTGGPPPCERFNCGSFNRCKNEMLACEAFAIYVRNGAACNPTEPNKKWWQDIMYNDWEWDE